MVLPRYLVAALLSLTAMGCSEVTSSSVATSAKRLPARSGPVAIFAANLPPSGANELGVVDAQGSATEPDVDHLFKELVRRTQELGGNALVIDWMGARIEVETVWTTQTYSYPCGRNMCMQTQHVPSTREIMVVQLHGRALSLPPEQAGGAGP